MAESLAAEVAVSLVSRSEPREAALRAKPKGAASMVLVMAPPAGPAHRRWPRLPAVAAVRVEMPLMPLPEAQVAAVPCRWGRPARVA